MSNVNLRKLVHSKSFGIEIECLVASMAFRRCKHYGMFYADIDSSIDENFGTKGVEFTSQPLPYGWLIKEIAKLWKKYPWQHNESCGIHVHVNRGMISEKRIKKLRSCLFDMPRNEIVSLFGRYSPDYANPYNLHSRYSAINICNEKTVEFRMFPSGDYKWAQECVRRTKLMVEFRGEPTYSNLFKLFWH